MSSEHVAWGHIWPALYFLVAIACEIVLLDALKRFRPWEQKVVEAATIVTSASLFLYLSQLRRPKSHRIPPWGLIVLSAIGFMAMVAVLFGWQLLKIGLFC